MSYAADVLTIIIAFAVFGYIHTLLASKKLKRIAAGYFGSLVAFYRLLYNLVSFITLYIFFELVPAPSLMIYELPYPWDFIILVPGIFAVAGLLWTTKFFSVSEFIGFSQIKRWMDGDYDINDLDEKFTFRAEGPYKFSRHPLYLFSIIFLACRPAMDLFYLTFLICLIAYFYIGSFYEERKLVDTLGGEYIKYQHEVPRIFPFL